MNYYKEIFLDFENNCKIPAQTYNLFSAETSYNKEENIQRIINKKGFTLSFDFYIIHCISESNSISLTITKTLSPCFKEKSTALNFQSKYRLNFNEHILNNEIFLYQISDSSFKITLLFENYDIKQLEFNLAQTTETSNQNQNTTNQNQNTINSPKFQVHEGTLPMDKSAKLTCADHIFFDFTTKSDYLACGTGNGNINILQVSNDFNNTLKSANLRELRYDFDYSSQNNNKNAGSSASPFSFNFKQRLSQFFSAKPQPSAVKSVKFLKDHLICYITEDGKFRIFNQLTNREVYCNEKLFGFMSGGFNNSCNNQHQQQENFLKCKIEFLDYDASRNFFLETSSKILFFCVYVEYANSQFLNIFELQFLDIPLSNEITNNDVINNIYSNNYNLNYNNVFALSDYGSTIRFNNNKVVPLGGKLIDLKTIKDKFWSIARKSVLESDEQSEEALFIKYEIKIFNTFKLQNENEEEANNNINNINSSEENTLNEANNNKNNNYFEKNETNRAFFNHTNQTVILLDHKLKNFALTIKQMSLTKNEKSRNKSLYRLLLSAERIISNEQLMNFNRKLAETNVSQMTANNPSTQTRNFLRECETQKELVNRCAILNRIFLRGGTAAESFNADSLLGYIQSLIFDSFENRIISLGCVRNRNLDSVCVLRENGIGFLRYAAEFQKVNEAVGFHEANFREIVFGSEGCYNNGFLSGGNAGNEEQRARAEGLGGLGSNKEVRLMRGRILAYVAEQSQVTEDNPLLVCLALLRVLLAENYVDFSDYNNFVDFFNCDEGFSKKNHNAKNATGFQNNFSFDGDSKNIKDFVKELFGEKLQKENSMLFLDVFNSVISKIFKSNVDLMLKNFEDINRMFSEYQNSDLARKIGKFAQEENSLGGFNRNITGASFVSADAVNKYDFKFNSKFCEIIKKITQDKIEALFNLSRDLVAFSQWVESYHYDLVITKANKLERLEQAAANLLKEEQKEQSIRMELIEQVDQQPYNYILQHPDSTKKKDFKLLAQRALRIFSHCYSIFILSNLSNSLMLPEKSAFEKLCIFIEEREDDNNFNYLDLKIYNMFNKHGQSIFKFFNEDLVDYLITNIWSGLFIFTDKSQLIIKNKSEDLSFNVNNKNIIFKTFTNLLYFREIGLINSLLHLLYDNNSKLTTSASEDQIASLINPDSAIEAVSEQLESCFIRLAAYAKLDNRKKFIKALNSFISVVCTVSAEAQGKVKALFTEFYANFSNSQSDYASLIKPENLNVNKINNEVGFFVNKKNEGGEAPLDQSALNFKLFVFYLLEEFLSKRSLLNADLMFDFYYNSFNFVFPLIKNTGAAIGLGQISNLSSVNVNFNFACLRNQKFLLNFLNSCLQVDFDLSLTFYLSVINEVYNLKDLNEKMLEIFVAYIIDFMKKPKTAQFFPRSLIDNSHKNLNLEAHNQRVLLSLENNSLEPNFSNNFLIAKIILSDPRLLVSICRYLENECLEAKNNKKLSAYLGIKESLLKENLSNLKMDVKMSINVFYLLHKIYSDMKDFHNAARISLLYNQALDDLIKCNVLSLDEMIRVYTEKNVTLQNLAFGLKRIENKKSAIYLLKMKKLNSANIPNNFIIDKDYIELPDVKREKIMNDLRLRVFEELRTLSINNPTIKSDKENLQKLKNDSFLFNMIFKLNLDNYLNDFKILFSIEENLTKNTIVNIIRVNLLRGETSKGEEEKPEFNKNKIFKSRERTNPNELFNESEVKILNGETNSFIFNSALKKFFSHLIKNRSFILISLAIETILSIHSNVDLPIEFLKEAILLNTKSIMELLIKYKREKDLIYLIELCDSQDLLIDAYLLKIGDIYLSSKNYDLKYILKNYS